MDTTRTLIKTGDGNATAALVAGTVTNVAVVTLPSDPGYEYDVSISVSLKLAGTGTVRAAALIGGISFPIYSATTLHAAGDTLSFPSLFSSATLFSSEVNSVGSSNSAQPASPDLQKVHTVKYGPGAAVTCPIISNAADTYYLHYSYIGRKTVTESF